MTNAKTVGRSVLAAVFVGLAVYLGVSFVTMPYELVQICKTTAEPAGAGLFMGAVLAGVAAIVATFSPDWR